MHDLTSSIGREILPSILSQEKTTPPTESLKKGRGQQAYYQLEEEKGDYHSAASKKESSEK